MEESDDLNGFSFTFKEHLVLAWLKSVNYYIAWSQIKGWLIYNFFFAVQKGYNYFSYFIKIMNKNE